MRSMFSSRRKIWTGMFLFISLIKRACKFTLSNALERSREHRFAVVPLRTNDSTIRRTAYIAWLQLRPFLKPNWASEVFNKLPNLSSRQYSKTLDNIGLMAIITTRECDVVMRSVACVCRCVCVVWAFTFESLDLESSFLVLRCFFGTSIGQSRVSRSRSYERK